MKSDLRIAVLMGGPSGEHEISLKSGHGVAEALAQRHWIVEPVVIPKTLDVGGACAWTTRMLRQISADVVFLALHGTFGEDGTVQQVCENLHLPYTGSDATASRLGMDKVASRRRFEAAGLAVPRWSMMELATNASSVPAGVSYPVVVKPINQGSSLGVSIVRQAGALQHALAEAGRYGSRVLLEEFVEGRELTVGILGDESLPVVEICPHASFFDFAAKYTPGLTDYRVPASLAPDVATVVQAAARTAHRALGCRHFSRGDFILTRGQVPVLLEINTIPGFTPTSLLPKAAASVGISYGELCEQLVSLALSGVAETASHE